MCNWKWQLFILFSEYRETDAIKRQQLWHISHYNLQMLIHAEGDCVGQTLKKKKNKRKKELLQKWWHFMFRNPWSHWELDFLLSVPSFTLQIDKDRLIWAFSIHKVHKPWFNFQTPHLFPTQEKLMHDLNLIKVYSGDHLHIRQSLITFQMEDG